MTWAADSGIWRISARGQAVPAMPAADGVRLGRLAARDVDRLLATTVLDGLRRRGGGQGVS